MKKLFVMVSGCALLNACAVEKAEDIGFAQNTLTVQVSRMEYLPFAVTPAALQYSRKVSWEYDPQYITVSADSGGVAIEGIKEGQTYLKAKTDGISTTCLLTIEQYNPDYKAKPFLYSAIRSVHLALGGTAAVSVRLLGGRYSDLENITWSVPEARDGGELVLTPNRNSVVIRAVKKGEVPVQARHPDCAAPYTFIVFSGDAPEESEKSSGSKSVTVTALLSFMLGLSLLYVLYRAVRDTVVRLKKKLKAPCTTAEEQAAVPQEKTAGVKPQAAVKRAPVNKIPGIPPTPSTANNNAPNQANNPQNPVRRAL